MAIKLSDEVSKICTSKIKQSDLTKIESKTKEEATSAANKKINEITQDQLKKVTSIIEKTPLSSSSDKVTQQDITNFVKVNFTGDIATSVNKLIDKSADEIVKEQIGKLGRLINLNLCFVGIQHIDFVIHTNLDCLNLGGKADSLLSVITSAEHKE